MMAKLLYKNITFVKVVQVYGTKFTNTKKFITKDVFFPFTLP
jgi:hypothetical protein